MGWSRNVGLNEQKIPTTSRQSPVHEPRTVNAALQQQARQSAASISISALVLTFVIVDLRYVLAPFFQTQAQGKMDGHIFFNGSLHALMLAIDSTLESLRMRKFKARPKNTCLHFRASDYADLDTAWWSCSRTSKRIPEQASKFAVHDLSNSISDALYSAYACAEAPEWLASRVEPPDFQPLPYADMPCYRGLHHRSTSHAFDCRSSTAFIPGRNRDRQASPLRDLPDSETCGGFVRRGRLQARARWRRAPFHPSHLPLRTRDSRADDPGYPSFRLCQAVEAERSPHSEASIMRHVVSFDRFNYKPADV